MGSTFSSIIKRPIKNFNIDNRAQKIISPDVKPKVAPRHPTTEKIMKEQITDSNISNELKHKNIKLDKMLLNMVVETPKIPEIHLKAKNEKGKLPEDRSKVEHFEYGYLEPERVRPGRCTIRQCMDFLGLRQINPEKYKSHLIAEEYNLNEEDVKNVMKHFSVFLVHLPDRLKHSSVLQKMSTGIPIFIKKSLPPSKSMPADPQPQDESDNNTTFRKPS